MLNTLTDNTKYNSKQISDEILVQEFDSSSQDDQEEYPVLKDATHTQLINKIDFITTETIKHLKLGKEIVLATIKIVTAKLMKDYLKIIC